MQISREKKLRDLQVEFHERFRYLWLEFFRSPHREREGSREEDRLDPELQVGAVPGFRREGELELDGAQSTGAFELKLAEDFGLYVQVYRKSYGRWLQTWATDVWPLDEQNRRGRIMGDLGVEVA